MNNQDTRQKKPCANSTLVVGILARDCVKNLRKKMCKIEDLGSMFKDYHVVIYENDSTDGTAEEVKEWGRRNNHVLAISETSAPTAPLPPLDCPHPEKGVRRIERMARLRNRVMDEMEKRFDPDIFCFVDIDVEDFNPSDIVKAIENAPDDWGGLFGSGLVYWDGVDGDVFVSPFQYDSFAFVAQGDDYLKRGDYVVTPEFHPQVAYQMTLGLKKIDYLPCESAFNGIGVYRYNVIKGERYSILQNKALKDINCSLCEHIGFNRKVRDKGYGIYMARDMQVLYHHEKIANIVADIVYDYNGLCAMRDDQLPIGLSELKPGIKEVLRTWNEMRSIQKYNENTDLLHQTLSRVQQKNHKHLRWLRVLIGICVVEALALVASFFI